MHSLMYQVFGAMCVRVQMAALIGDFLKNALLQYDDFSKDKQALLLMVAGYFCVFRAIYTILPYPGQ